MSSLTVSGLTSPEDHYVLGIKEHTKGVHQTMDNWLRQSLPQGSKPWGRRHSFPHGPYRTVGKTTNDMCHYKSGRSTVITCYEEKCVLFRRPRKCPSMAAPVGFCSDLRTAFTMCEMGSSWRAEPMSYAFLYIPHPAPLEHDRVSITVE